MTERTPAQRMMDGLKRLVLRHGEVWALVLAASFFAFFMWGVLDVRPMHHDEANQAYAARRLLDGGGYRFRSDDHHGPTLYYATIPVAWAQGVFHGGKLSIRTVRAVPLLATIGLMFLPLAMGRTFGRGSRLVTAVVMAFSSCFCYYSGYFIQETLLVLFTAATALCGWAWFRRGGIVRALLFGAFGGLAIATKETWVLSAAAAVCTLLIMWGMRRISIRNALRRRCIWEFMAALCALTAVVVVFYSSFFTNWRGLSDFVQCWQVYLQRGTSSSSPMAQPFWTYARWLFWWHVPPMPVWSEWLLLVGFLLAAVQLFVGWGRPRGLDRHVLEFTVIYSVCLFLIYSAIPYKTPWCSLGFLYGMALAAGSGYAGLLFNARYWMACVFSLLFVLGCWQMLPHCRMCLSRYATDARNPFAYAHTQRDFLRLPALIHRTEGILGRPVHVAMVLDHVNHWPLPWYLPEDYPVDYCDFHGWGILPSTDSTVRSVLASRPEIVVTSPEFSESLELTEYEWDYVTLRPNLLISVGLRKDCAERLRQ